MKYLKLKTAEELPSFTKDEKTKKGHITFVFFGDSKIDTEHMTKILKQMSSFELIKSHKNFFGPNNDIPVIVYKIKEDNINIHNSRLELLKAFKLLDQNYEIWNPHISNVSFDESPDIIHVKGLESNDESFNIYLNKC